MNANLTPQRVYDLLDILTDDVVTAERANEPGCRACQVVMVNGVRTHERGCPHGTRECAWCGCHFDPEHRNQRCCSDDCLEAWRG